MMEKHADRWRNREDREREKTEREAGGIDVQASSRQIFVQWKLKNN